MSVVRYISAVITPPDRATARQNKLVGGLNQDTTPIIIEIHSCRHRTTRLPDSMRCLIVIVLLGLLATASADTQASHSVQSSQSAQGTQGTQGTQNSQIFGLPPLPVALVAAGALLQKIHSPIKLNAQVVTDQPAQQPAPPVSTTGSADAVYYGQAAAGKGDTEQLYISGNQPVSGGSKPSVPPGVTSWIQNPDGTITPLKWDQPDAQVSQG